jgi:hypothetical protein
VLNDHCKVTDENDLGWLISSYRLNHLPDGSRKVAGARLICALTVHRY